MQIAPATTGPETRGPTLSFYVKAVAIALFILLFASTAERPFHLDNVDFPVVAEQTAITGIPVCYRGEDRPHDSGLSQCRSVCPC